MYLLSIDPYKKITKEDLQSDKELYTEICLHIQTLYENSSQYTSNKRKFLMQIDEQLKTLRTSDALTYDMIYAYQKAFLSMFQWEWLSPVFTEREFSDKDFSDKLNKVADFDIEIMNKQQKDVKMISDVFFYWVWIRAMTWWNKSKKVPVFSTISPLARYPDPNWNVFDENFDYHIFTRDSSLEEIKYKEMTEWWYFNIDEVSTWSQARERNEMSSRKQRLMWQPDQQTQSSVNIYIAYITINEYRYICTLANDMTTIIKRECIDPITKEEKDKQELPPFPISLSYTTPNVYDPFWESYCEKIRPIQVAMSEISEAIHQKQLRDAWFSVMWFDVNKVQNVSDLLERPNWWPLRVPVDWLNTPVTAPLLEHTDTTNSANYIQQLQSQVENITSLTWTVRWQDPTTWTLWETQIQMQRSSSMFSVDINNMMIWERQFWYNIYYRSIKKNLSEEKIAVLSDENIVIILEKKDLVSWIDPNLKIISKSQMMQKNKEQWAAMMALFPIVQQDQSLPPIAKKIYLRDMFSKQWIQESAIDKFVPYDWSELYAQTIVEMVNAWEMPDDILMEWIDLQTLYLYMQWAIDNKIKTKVMAFLNLYMIQEGTQQQQQQQWWIEWMANSMWSQMMWNQIAQQNKQAENSNILLWQ